MAVITVPEFILIPYDVDENYISSTFTDVKPAGMFCLKLRFDLKRFTDNFLCVIDRLFAYCKGGNFNFHIWAWFGYFICQGRENSSFYNLVKN